MILSGRLNIYSKALLQLGPEPLALNMLYRFGLWTGYYRRIEDRAIESRERPPTLHFVFGLPDRARLLKIIGAEGKAALLKEAGEILKGKVRPFGGKPVPLQLAFEKPLLHWTDYEVNPELLRPLYSPITDIKFTWEPARFGWAFTLGRAYHLTGNAKYAQTFWKYFEKFVKGNPPYFGPHWMNGQEVAIRLMALVWSAQVFAQAAASTPRRRERLKQSIKLHAARIPPTLIYARSQNNNHLITEAAALYGAGAALEQPQWLELGWRWLNRALQRQIGPSGEYIQHSTNYHRLMLQTALWADAIRRGRSEVWSSPTLDALKRASHWLFSILDPVSGKTPNLGANDGALLLPLSSMPNSDYRPTVQAAARAFLRTGLSAGRWDELALWLGLAASAHTAGSAAYAAEHLRGKHSWAYLRASSFKSRLSHMDQLHLDLWWRGLNVAQDAGTYVYNSEAPWDNPLVSSRVHNTVTVDGREQMTRGGTFLTLDWFPAFSKNVLVADGKQLGRLLAHHKGYRRVGVRHERFATVLDGDRWQIRDTLILAKPGDHVFRLHWLLPDWPWRIERGQQGQGIGLKSPRGWTRILLQTDPPFSLSLGRVSVVRAGELVYGKGSPLPFEGWVSPTYGQKVPALSLVFEAPFSTTLSFLTEFVFPS